MDIDPYLREDEARLDHLETDGWNWICTDQRVFKYHKKDAIDERPEVSLADISDIHLQRQVTFQKLFALFGLFVGGSLVFVPGYGIGSLFLGVASWLITSYIYLTQFSDRYYQLEVDEVIEYDQNVWRIKASSPAQPVDEFIQTIRNQLGTV